jgi:hypothetical protein
LLRGNDAGRSVLLRRIDRNVIAVKEFESIRKGAIAYGKVRHPTFVKLLGVIEQDTDLVTVSEHLVGAPLMDVLRQVFDEGDPLPATVAVRIVLDSAKATIKAHRLSAESGIFPTKRLFLPEGVFIASYGGTLLSEIGTLTAIANCTTAKTIPDVLAQLAPEEITAGSHSKGSPEVFSLGVLLWECLANRWLFSQESEHKAKADLTTATIPSLDTIERFGTHVPESLVDLVKTATERSPMRRFESVDRFITALEQLPAHFIATEHQVAETLRKHASDLIVRGTVDDSQLTASGTFSEAPQSAVPTLPPVGSTFEAESPTFAQRRLISQPSSGAPPATTLSPPKSSPSALNGARNDAPVAQGNALVFTPNASTSELTPTVNANGSSSRSEPADSIASLRTRLRLVPLTTRYPWLGLVVLSVVFLVLGSFAFVKWNTKPNVTLETEETAASARPREHTQRAANASLAPSATQLPSDTSLQSPMPALADGALNNTRSTANEPGSASNRDTTTPEPNPGTNGSFQPVTHKLPTKTGKPPSTYRPRQIAPYHPTGI